MLRTLPENFKSNWNDHLNKVIHAYNCMRTESTGYSPYYLLYGRHPRLPIDIAFNIDLPAATGSHREYVTKWQSAMKEAYKIASQRSNAAGQTTKRYFDKKAHYSDLNPSDPCEKPLGAWWKKLKNIIPQSKLCSVYYAIVESHLRYANEIWGSLPKTKLDTLQRLQDRARSIVENARYKDNWSCDWLSVENIIRFDRSVMTYKIRNKLSPESFWDKFQQRSLQSNYATRNCRDLQIPRLNTEHAKKSYRYSAIKIWNDIPVAIRELPTIIRFKKELKEYLKS